MSKGDFPSGRVAVVELEPRSDHSRLSTHKAVSQSTATLPAVNCTVRNL
jgi:hypothetical protein